MKVAIASEDNNGLSGEVSMHFGRCQYYVIAEVQNGKVVKSSTAENPFFANHQPGRVPAFIKELGAHAILAGGMGPRAVQIFQGFGIDVATGAVGKIENVLNAYLRGDLTGIVPCSHDHPESCDHH
jgi:predicted Fe-Mo cluster-binding NifX family protein